MEASILIIGDPLNSQVALPEVLVQAGFYVVVVRTEDHALAQLANGVVDLILLNVDMPDVDEFGMCDRIKNNPKTRDIPIIFMAACPDSKKRVTGLTIGAVDYLSKSFDLDEALARIRIHLQIRTDHQTLQGQIHQQQHTIRVLEKSNKVLSRLANLDALTQIANRYCFDESLEEEWLRLAREQKPLGLILCDVDYFKRYNDHYGHQAGDNCLRRVARCLHQLARRPADLVARYGGEEFVILLPGADVNGVQYIAETMRTEVESLNIPHQQSQTYRIVTISLGGCSLIPNRDFPPNTIVQLADKELYNAKREGRNRLSITTSPNYPEISMLFDNPMIQS